MREKREKWGENGRKQGANYEWREWREWGAKNGGETTKYAKNAKFRGGKGKNEAQRGWKRAENRKNGLETTKYAKNSKNGEKMAENEGRTTN